MALPSNPLTDVLPPTWRRYFYAVLFLAAIAFAAYQASQGDWLEFVGGLIVALGGGALPASNTSTE